MANSAEIYVDTEEWTGQVGRYNVDVAFIHQMPSLPFSYTDLSPFTNFNQVIENLNASLSKYQSYVNSQSSNLIKVSDNKQMDDESGAANLKNGMR